MVFYGLDLDRVIEADSPPPLPPPKKILPTVLIQGQLGLQSSIFSAASSTKTMFSASLTLRRISHSDRSRAERIVCARHGGWGVVYRLSFPVHRCSDKPYLKKFYQPVSHVHEPAFSINLRAHGSANASRPIPLLARVYTRASKGPLQPARF